MRIVVDTSVLLYLAYPNAPAPKGADGKRIEHCEQRIEGFLEDADNSETEIIIPTPVLSELLIRAQGRQAEILAAITGKRAVIVQPFDLQAAIENAALKREKELTRPFLGQARGQVSFDLQILAIARVAQAGLVLTDDARLRKRCELISMPVKGIGELDVPESKRQMAMELPAEAKPEKKGSSRSAGGGAPVDSPAGDQ